MLGSAGTESRGSIGGGMLDVTTVEAYMLHRESIRLPEDDLAVSSPSRAVPMSDQKVPQ